MVNSACGNKVVHMCCDGTGTWGGEIISRHKGSGVFWPFLAYYSCLIEMCNLIHVSIFN